MIYLSFVEIFVKSNGAFHESGHSERDAYLCATLCLFSGLVLMRLIEFLTHKLDKNHQNCCDVEEIRVDVQPPEDGTAETCAAAGDLETSQAAPVAQAAEQE